MGATPIDGAMCQRHMFSTDRNGSSMITLIIHLAFHPDKIEKGIITITKSDYALKTGAYGIRTSSSLY